MPLYISPPPANPLSRLLLGLVGLLVLAGSFMLGLLAFLVAAGLALVAGLAVWLRVAWLRRQLRKQGFEGDPEATPRPAAEQAIDAEYTVVSRHREE